LLRLLLALRSITAGAEDHLGYRAHQADSDSDDDFRMAALRLTIILALCSITDRTSVVIWLISFASKNWANEDSWSITSQESASEILWLPNLTAKTGIGSFLANHQASL
jgi:hypothetical protein